MHVNMPSPESVPGLNPSHADVKADVRRSYSSIRRDIAAGKSFTVLYIGAEQTWVAIGSGSEPAAMLVLAIGSSKTASDHFKHTPPTPAEMEYAIQDIEDEIARA